MRCRPTALRRARRDRAPPPAEPPSVPEADDRRTPRTPILTTDRAAMPACRREHPDDRTAQPSRPRLHRRPWLLPLVAVLLTGLAGGVLLWALQGRQASGPAVPVAIVNADKPVTTGSGKDQKTIAAGRELAAGLTQPDPSDQTPLSWELVDSDDAAEGLRNGGYYAVLTIPEGFSAAVNSVSGNDPKAAELQLVSNDASSSAVAALAQLAVDQAGATLGDQVTSGFTDNTLQSFTSIHNSLTSSAKSAHQLADSSHELADSSDTLADSSDSLADGADSLASGARQLAAGAAESDDGCGPGGQWRATALRRRQPAAERRPGDRVRSRPDRHGRRPGRLGATPFWRTGPTRWRAG